MTTYQFNLVDKIVNNGRPLSQRSLAISNMQDMPQNEIIIDNQKFKIDDLIKHMKRNYSDDLLKIKKNRTPMRGSNYTKRKESG